jgi:RNA polymerase sigma factor (sigma-70 family)
MVSAHRVLEEVRCRRVRQTGGGKPLIANGRLLSLAGSPAALNKDPYMADDWDAMVAGLRSGDETAIRQFCERYGESLERLAERNLAMRVLRRVGPDDVAQSACRTFLRRARIGEFELADSKGLWGILCAITINKVREQTRFHLRAKRGLDRETHPTADDSVGGQSAFFNRPSAEATPADAAEFADQFTRLIESLDAEQRQLVDLKLQQCTNLEIAEQMGLSERTVRRILKRVQAALARHFDVPAGE